ncbi:MAG: class I SAM-dependent methyltransferase [Candidatus Hermodarchaeota archaeon]
MEIEILKELDIEGLRATFLRYTRKVFEIIPKLDNPRILDIGCGTGLPTLELARLTNGEIIGIDIDQIVLNKLKNKINAKGLSNKIKIFNRSIYDTKFEDEMFDIIWDEGVIHILDLKRALNECNRLLKTNGYLISGEATNWANRKLKHFPKFGFKLINQIPWAEQCWWKEYYAPLEKKIDVLRKKYENIDNIKQITQFINEIEMVKKNPTGFDCTTYILQKIK